MNSMILDGKMRSIRSTIAVSSSLIALSLILGCQIPFLGSAAHPNVVVNFGSLSILPTASLAIAMRFDGDGQFNVQDLQKSNVQKVVVTVMGPNLAQPLTVTVTRDHFNENEAIANFTNLPEGPISVAASAIDANGTVLSYASGTATIVKGQTAVLTLLCQTTGGSLQVIYDCPDCTAASPSPAPSPQDQTIGPQSSLSYVLPASDSLSIDNIRIQYDGGTAGSWWSMQVYINGQLITPDNAPLINKGPSVTMVNIWNGPRTEPYYNGSQNPPGWNLFYSPDFVSNNIPSSAYYASTDPGQAYHYVWNVEPFTMNSATMSVKIVNIGNQSEHPIVVQLNGQEQQVNVSH